MSQDTFKPINDDRPAYGDPAPSSDASRTLLAGVVGGVLSAAGYLVYSRLPDDQKDRVHAQVRSLIEGRVSELRGKFNL